MLSLTSLMPTFWPAKTWLRLIFLLPNANTAAVGDGDGAVVKRVLEIVEAAIRRREGAVELGWVLHVERLVRTLVVVAVEEVVELGLLLQEVLGRGLGGFFFQGQVHALMAAILLRDDRV